MKNLILAATLAIGLLCGAAAAQDSAPPKELVQWVKDARQAGMADDQIQKNAVLAGWPEKSVIEVLHANTMESAKPKADAKPDSTTHTDATTHDGATTDTSAPAPKKAVPGQSAGDSPAKDGAGGAPAAPAGAQGGAQLGGIALTPPSADPGITAAPGGSVKAPAVDRGVPDDYQIGAGDQLHIMVFHEPDASVAGAVVRPDGRISMPLLKEVAVVGLTPPQLEKQITEQLAKFLTAPDVTVIVSGIGSKKIYMIGAVKKEGPIPFTYRMTVMQALSEAGGLTDYAKRKKIYVLRIENGREFKLPFDYDAVLKGLHMELNVPLMAGDTIVVPH